MRWFLPATLVLVLGTAGALFALAGDDSPRAPEATPSGVAWTRPTPSTSGEAGYVPTSPQTATPSPAETPASGSPFPPAKWTEVSPDQLISDGGVRMFLLELSTGRMFAATEEATGDFQVGISWLDNGHIAVSYYGGGADYIDEGATFAGDFLGRMDRIPGFQPEVSSRGIAAFETEAATLLYDLARKSVLGAVSDRPPGYMGRWSPDGKYLYFSTTANSLTQREDMTRIWDIDTQRVVASVPSEGLGWSHVGNKFIYVVRHGDDDAASNELRMTDVDRSFDKLVTKGRIGASWSPDDRFLILSAYEREGEGYSFSVYDVEAEQELFTAKGSWPMGWTDPDTIGFLGGSCGPTAYYTIDASGGGLTLHSEFADWTVAHPSPDGRQIAYTARREYPRFTLAVEDLSTGKVREYDAGGAWLPPYSGPERSWWSPDGEFLVVMIPPGKGGPCEFDEPYSFELIRHP